MFSLKQLKTEVIKTDVLVLGGGIAGCLASIYARKSGLDVTLVDKGDVGRSGISPLMSGVLSYFDPEDDNYDEWYRECVEAGEWLNDQQSLGGMINETTDRITDLHSWGVRFQQEHGKFIRKPMVGHIHARNILMIYGGFQLMSVVRGEVLRRGVRVIERVMITDLLTSDGELPTGGSIVGAVGFNVRTGTFYVIKAKAAVICTGMAASVFLRPIAAILSGDGRAMAFRAGCEMRNVDLTIYGPHPTGFNCAPGLNILTGEGALFVNAKGDRFMQKWDPVRMERATRAIVSRAIATEEREGRAPVSLDATHLDEAAYSRIEKCIPVVVRSFELAGLNLRKDKIAYTVNLLTLGPGGIRVNRENAATIPALYAAGAASDHAEMGVTEVITPGILSAIGGCRAGEEAAKYAAEIEEPTIDERQIQVLKEQIFAPMDRESGLKHQEVTQHCKGILAKGLLGPIKSEKGLKEAISAIREIRQDEIFKLVAKDYHELARSIGLANALNFLEIFARCSLLRRESRGSHFRVDYPEKNDTNWLKWVIVKKEDDAIKVWAEPIPYEKYPLKPNSAS